VAKHHLKILKLAKKELRLRYLPCHCRCHHPLVPRYQAPHRRPPRPAAPWTRTLPRPFSTRNRKPMLVGGLWHGEEEASRHL
jgi:hypothetical protein